MASCAPVGNRRPLACFTRGSGGLATRRRLPTCPTTSAEFAFVGKVSGIGRNRLRHHAKACVCKVVGQAVSPGELACLARFADTFSQPLRERSPDASLPEID